MIASGILLVRHTEIAERYHGICYGASDVELSPNGVERGHQVASDLAAMPVTRIMHSGLVRTRFLAERLGELTRLEPTICEGIRERDFGDWELQPWQAILTQQGEDMQRIFTEPESYRPGGGETTYEMRDRIVTAFQSLPRDGLTIVVTHGGPIAVWLGTQRKLPIPDWLGLIPGYGEIVPLMPGTGEHSPA